MTPKGAVVLCIALLSTLAIGAAQNDCNNCYGHGTIAYQSAFLCRCTCSKNETISNGIVSILEFLPPNCRYTTAQVYRALVKVQTPLAQFSFTDFTNTLTYNLGLNSTATLHLITLTNSTNSVAIDFEFRDEGVSVNGYQAATYDYLLLRSQFNMKADWTVAAQITSVQPVEITASQTQGISVLFSISGYPIPTETAVVLTAILLVCCCVVMIDLIATDNFYKTDEEGKAALEAFRSAQFYAGQYAAPEEVENPNENPISPSASPPHPEPRTAWPETPDADDDDSAPKPAIRRQSTKNMKDYSKKFYANA